jgi:hypothetical protein
MKHAVMSATADSSGGELCGALQRNAKHRGQAFNHLWQFLRNAKKSEIESLASWTSSAASQLRSAQNDISGCSRFCLRGQD